ncbi:T9SS type A sorting domain-containing protein [bacterium]|nr:T9SS type A sorting domain-containing protein [bacterium]
MRQILCILFAALLFVTAPEASARILHVGPSRNLTLPSHAASAAQDGDTILIDAGEYADAARWTADRLLIRGTGGVHVRDKTYGGKAIWVIQGNDTVVEGIEFSGARVPDKNGAGIRQEGRNLTLRHCYFHHNEMGILTSNDAESHILFEYCEFADNGYGDGFSHNMYINHVGRFTMRFCYSHDAVIGHNVKSRAHETWLLYNRLDEANGGRTSREIDIPNGGLAVIVGNVMDHGLNTDNSNLLGFGHEGYSNPRRALFVVNNTFVTARGAGGFVTLPSSPADTVLVYNNIFAGRATPVSGATLLLDSASNIARRDIADAGFQNPGAGDFTLMASSPAIDAGSDPGTADGFTLLPGMQYRHPLQDEARPSAGPVDCGAFEYLPPVGIRQETSAAAQQLNILSLAPQPAQHAVTVSFRTAHAGPLQLAIHDVTGKRVVTHHHVAHAPGKQRIRLDVQQLRRGYYFVEITDGKHRSSMPMIIR